MREKVKWCICMPGCPDSTWSYLTVMLRGSPLPQQAVCCEDKTHCCPEGAACDVQHNKCTSTSTRKETPMWAKFPARMRADWGQNWSGSARSTYFLIPIHYCLNLCVCVSSFRRWTSHCKGSCWIPPREHGSSCRDGRLIRHRGGCRWGVHPGFKVCVTSTHTYTHTPQTLCVTGTHTFSNVFHFLDMHLKKKGCAHYT